MIPQKRLEEFDYLRGFAILAVVAIHTSANFVDIANINFLLITNVIIDVFSRYAVPLFIFISGFVLFNKYSTITSQKQFYKKRAKSVLPQYLFFSVVYILLRIALSAFNGELKVPSMLHLIYYFFTASGYYHLWFFALIIQFYIFYPYIAHQYNKFEYNDKAILFLILVFALQQVWLIFVGVPKTYSNSIVDLLLGRMFLSHIFYFVLGIYVCQNYQVIKEYSPKFKNQALLIILLLTAIISSLWIKGIITFGNYYNIPSYYFIIPHIIGTLYYPLIFSVFLIVSINLSCKNNRYSNTVHALGKYSFGIYLIHVLYLQLIISVVYPQFNIDFNQIIFYPILFVSTILLSYLSVYFISYLPHSEMIVGIRNYKN